jgi:hypothetical protein
MQTSLKSQLNNLKTLNVATKLDPNKAPPSLLFSEKISRLVDIDLLYSMAIFGYEKMK